MKIYKLLKHYPSLPKTYKKGKVVFLRGGSYREQGATHGYPLDKEEVENNPEFWEEVIEEQLRVLSIWNSNNSDLSNRVFKRCFNGTFKWGGEDYSEFSDYITEEKLLESKFNTIHSVITVDDEVFSIGDKVKYYDKNTTIKCIYYNEHNQLSFKVEGNKAPLTGCFGCFHLKKLGKPIFTTEDGVEMFENIYYYCVTKYDDFNITKVKSNNFSKDYISEYPFTKRFSTKEAAKEYIMENKKGISIKEIRSAYRTTHCEEIPKEMINILKHIINE